MATDGGRSAGDEPRAVVVADLEARGWDNVARDVRARRAGRRRKGNLPPVEDAYLSALDLIVHLRRAMKAGVDVGNAYEVAVVTARVLRRRFESGDATAAAAGVG